MKDVNRLDRTTQRQLEDHILSKKEEIEAGKWSQVTFAEYYQRKVGRPITTANISGAAKAVAVFFNNGNSGKTPNKIKEIEATIKILAAEIASLRGEMGSTVSPIIRSLAGLE